MDVPPADTASLLEVRCYFVRHRNALLVRANFSPLFVDYYLHLLSGVPTSHASKRLQLFDCADASAAPLTEKVLRRPRLLVFCDNRQDAAFQAGWMKDHARRFRLRALMADGMCR